MDIPTLQAILKSVAATNATSTVHTKPYPSISPTRPELSQAGHSVLITGGGTGIGYSIARNFVRAGADTVVIVGRRGEVLEKAKSGLHDEMKNAGGNHVTNVVTRVCDVTNTEDINALWDELAAKGIVVDVLVNSAAKFTETKPLLDLGADEVWSQMEANVKAPIYLVEKFCGQKATGDAQKFIINLTSAVIHQWTHPAVAMRPGYIFTKLAAAMYFQLLAQETPVDKVQIVTVHPGLVYNDAWKEMGLGEENFEDADLSGGFAVWLASKEAAFLHGRTVWATWDVDELKGGELRKRMESDEYFLRISVVGLKEGTVI